MSQQGTTFTSWSSPSEPPGVGTQASLGPSPVWRSSKDELLSGHRSQPDTLYPDGYLGTMSSNRRQDKVLGTLSRMNARQYSRGVHKGERVNPGDYLWPDEFNNMTGIMLESQGKKFSPPGAEPVRLTNDGKVGPRGIPSPDVAQVQEMNPERRTYFKNLKPAWR
jgi:hypothetical protein